MELRINDRIRTTTIKLFNKVRLNLKYDSIADTFSFEYYFNPNNHDHKELSCIGHYHIAEIWHNDEMLLRGYILSIAFNSSAVAQMVTVGGYSLSGVLEDCEIPIGIDGMTLDNNELTLTQIASRYLQPFGIGLIVDGKLINEANEVTLSNAQQALPYQVTIPGLKPFETTPSVAEIMTPVTYGPVAPNPSNPASVEASNLTPDGVVDKYGIKITPWGNDTDTVTEKMDISILSATAQVGQNIKQYLSKLASYQNIILSHDAYGNVVFTKSVINHKVVATFKKGVPGTSMSLAFNGQSMHSHVTAVQQPDAMGQSKAGYQSTLRNPYVPYVFRPKVITVNQPEDGIDHTLTAAKNFLCNELKGIRVIITTDRWTFPNGKVMRPNNCVIIENDEIYLYKPSKWFIESVELEGDEKKEIAKITCVLPSCYDYSQPTYLFHGINEH